MAIKSVTTANLAEHVADKRIKGAQIASFEDIATLAPKAEKPGETVQTEDGKNGKVIVEAKAETVEGMPPDGVSENPHKKGEKGKNPVQDRIDELVRNLRETEEFAEGEYSGRLALQRRVDELETSLKTAQAPVAKAPEDEPEPDPAKYTDQKAFLKDWGDWNRKAAIKSFQAAEADRRRKEEGERLVAEAKAREKKSIAEARQVFKDYDEVVGAAAREVERKERSSFPAALAFTLANSDYQAHILYHFARNPEEAERVIRMSPAQAALALGRLETKFAKDAEDEPPPPETPKTPRAPPPIPSLNGAGGETTPADMSKPMPYADYKRKRMDELRRKRGR